MTNTTNHAKTIRDLKKFIELKSAEKAWDEIVDHVRENSAEIGEAFGTTEERFLEAVEKRISESQEHRAILNDCLDVCVSVGRQEFARGTSPVSVFARANEAALKAAFGPHNRLWRTAFGELLIAAYAPWCEGIVRGRLAQFDTWLADSIVASAKVRAKKLTGAKKLAAQSTAQAAADHFSESVRIESGDMVFDIMALMQSCLTTDKDLRFVFSCYAFDVAIPQARLLAIKALKKKDLSAWVDKDGLHVRWNRVDGRARGGFNFRPMFDDKSSASTRTVLVARASSANLSAAAE